MRPAYAALREVDELQHRGAQQRPAPRPTAPRREGDLTITDETVMVEVPRGDREVLRLTFTRATTAAGKAVAWHALRVWYRAEDGQLRAGRAGVTIRGAELRSVAEALAKAASGGQP
jgi:hypothetical protein